MLCYSVIQVWSCDAMITFDKMCHLSDMPPQTFLSADSEITGAIVLTNRIGFNSQVEQ